jgi:hypothetical protein
MMRRIAIVTILIITLGAVFAAVAWASSATTAQIIQDASDGTINGHYTVAEVRAALAAVESDPSYSQYSDIETVIANYLSSLLAATATPTPTPRWTAKATVTPAPTPSPSAVQQLDYTGGQPLLLFAMGGALLCAGAVLWRRSSVARRS